jgi:hypothetical protein
MNRRDFFKVVGAVGIGATVGQVEAQETETGIEPATLPWWTGDPNPPNLKDVPIGSMYVNLNTGKRSVYVGDKWVDC